MKRVPKPITSRVITEGLNYREGRDNSNLSEVLKEEQNFICAYTECRITASTAVDIDHFNPNLKGDANDGYSNWFLISTKNNRKKSDKWEDYQPILHPSSNDFDNRIRYNPDSGEYEWDNNDNEAKNLSELIGLNDHGLVGDRKQHVDLIKSLLVYFGNDPDNLKNNLLSKFTNQIQFNRALETSIQGLNL